METETSSMQTGTPSTPKRVASLGRTWSFGLALRASFTLVLVPVLTFLYLLAIPLLFGWAAGSEGVRDGTILLAIALAVAAYRSWSSRAPEPWQLPDGREGKVRGIVERLAVVADVTAPPIVIDDDRKPNAWTTTAWRGAATVHVTSGLLDMLSDEQLEAVLAHELGHIVNRDGILMSAAIGCASAPRSVVELFWLVLDDNDRASQRGKPWFVAVLAIPAALSAVAHALIFQAAALLSREREYAADRFAAVVTGSAERVADALLTLDGSGQPVRDLRIAAAAEGMLHFCPRPLELEQRRQQIAARFLRTHPTTGRRLRALGVDHDR